MSVPDRLGSDDFGAYVYAVGYVMFFTASGCEGLVWRSVTLSSSAMHMRTVRGRAGRW